MSITEQLSTYVCKTVLLNKDLQILNQNNCLVFRLVLSIYSNLNILLRDMQIVYEAFNLPIFSLYFNLYSYKPDPTSNASILSKSPFIYPFIVSVPLSAPLSVAVSVPLSAPLSVPLSAPLFVPVSVTLSTPLFRPCIHSFTRPCILSFTRLCIHSLYLSLYLPILTKSPFIRPPYIRLSICPYNRPCNHPFIYLSVRPFVTPSVSLVLSPSIFPNICVHAFFFPFLCPKVLYYRGSSLYLTEHLSFHLF